MTNDQGRMTNTEERLKTAIAAVQQHPQGSYPWRRGMNQLILEIQHLPGLVKSPHPDYGEVLNDTLLRLADEIQNFEPQYPSLEQSLVAWINGKLRLKYAVLELSSHQGTPKPTAAQTAKTEFRQQTRKPPLSLDQPIAESRETFGDRISSPSLWELHAQIAHDLQQHQTIRIGLRLKDYIEQDPQGLLKNCHPNRYPRCNGQTLSQRLLLKNPPDRLSAIATEHQINYHTLNWHWKNKALPLLRAIALQLGYQPQSEQTKQI